MATSHGSLSEYTEDQQKAKETALAISNYTRRAYPHKTATKS